MEENGLTLEKLRIADKLEILEHRFDKLEVHFDEKMETISEFVKDVKIQIKTIDQNSNLQALNLADRMGNLPCKVQKNEMKWIKGSMYVLYIFVIGLIGKAVHSWMGGK